VKITHRHTYLLFTQCSYCQWWWLSD